MGRAAGWLSATLMVFATMPGCIAADLGERTSTLPEAVPGLLLSTPTRALGPHLREPMLAKHPGGTLFVTGIGVDSLPADAATGRLPRFWDRPLLYASRDEGSSWQRVDVGSIVDGAIGQSDKDLAVGPSGELYLAAMSFLIVPDPAGAGVSFYDGVAISVGVSLDTGASWKWTLLSHDRYDDRPWVEVAPDGTAHVIWNDGNGVHHAWSDNQGSTWTEGPSASGRGGSSSLAVGPNGALAVRVAPISASGHRFDAGVDGVAISRDGGATWTWNDLPGSRPWNETDVPRFWDPLAFDDAGVLYAGWVEGSQEGPTSLRMGRSHDLGKTWEVVDILRDEDMLFFPYLTARGDGEVAMSVFVEDAERVTGRVAWITNASVLPQVRDAEFVRNGGGGEYFPVGFLDERRLGLATPLFNAQTGETGFEFRTATIT